MPLPMCVEFGYYISMCNIYVDQKTRSSLWCSVLHKKFTSLDHMIIT